MPQATGGAVYSRYDQRPPIPDYRVATAGIATSASSAAIICSISCDRHGIAAEISLRVSLRRYEEFIARDVLDGTRDALTALPMQPVAVWRAQPQTYVGRHDTSMNGT